MAAVFARRPECVLRLFFDRSAGARAGEWCSHLARERRIYRQVATAELEKIAGTVHHGGIVAVTEREAPGGVLPEDVAAWARVRRPLLVLDRIGNTHNLGAIVRSAAFFGVPLLCYGEHRDQAQPGEATYRIAEGGMEHVELRCVRGLKPFLVALREHYLVIGAALQGEPLSRLAPGGEGVADDRRPVALVLGNEEAGLAPAVLATCERTVLIPGTGLVESLNVSAAAAVLMHWFFGRDVESASRHFVPPPEVVMRVSPEIEAEWEPISPPVRRAMPEARRRRS